ncbi:MAG: ABC transporter ATP-binding protein [Elusimicrobia bacterium CG08_land_8_20_14_0_20_59_10]|nr:MAG: ABC transporter ATP-binding protein [Elusimicrobia bacterium CG08_land_8_20_14_0_20_59_10]
MSTTAIKTEGISKRYRIGASEGYRTFRETLTDAVKAPFKRLAGLGHPVPENETVWALNDVSFEVKKGEVLGIIGRNGAGKSTLLKILSRITRPTRGRVELRGRVGSLLEVGTGFHPELTGHENIYLYGAVLGMKSWEISRKFKEIVEFSEIGRFMDTPVKRYSSGMYMRLAFSVAAHLEPEILLVDEVLAVGDAAFQKKCLGKVGAAAGEGRTVIFVSHNMGALETLCHRGILLEGGCKVFDGGIHEAVSKYLAKSLETDKSPLENCRRRGAGKMRAVGFRLETPGGLPLEAAKSGEPAAFCFDFENRSCGPEERVSVSFSVQNEREFGLFHYYSHFSGVYFTDMPAKSTVRCLLPSLDLAPGNYFVQVCTKVAGETDDWPQVLLPLNVMGADFYGTGDPNLSTWGPMLVKGEWSLRRST